MKKLIIICVGFIIFSCEVAFVENISEETITLIAPSNDSELFEGSVNFHWNEVLATETYQLQVATPNFNTNTQIVLDTILTESSFNKELAIGDYQWRVKALNSDYETSYTTASFFVKDSIEDISNKLVELLAPANEVAISEGTISFSWSALKDAENYQLQIATPTFEAATQIVLDTILNTNSVEQELTQGEYQWRVKGINSNYETVYTTYSLTIN